MVTPLSKKVFIGFGGLVLFSVGLIGGYAGAKVKPQPVIVDSVVPTMKPTILPSATPSATLTPTRRFINAVGGKVYPTVPVATIKPIK